MDYKLPILDHFIIKRNIFESLEEEGVENVPMVDIVFALKEMGYSNDKILKVKNLLDADEESNVSIEDLVDAFINLGVGQETIGEIMADLTVEGKFRNQKLVYIVKDDKFYRYFLKEWKAVVDRIIANEDMFDPANHKDSIEKPKHIYQSADNMYYSSLPRVTIYDTQSWNLEDFKNLQASGYK